MSFDLSSPLPSLSLLFFEARLTLYQVFMLLMAEMSLFVVLIVPLPFNLKRKIFTYV